MVIPRINGFLGSCAYSLPSLIHVPDLNEGYIKPGMGISHSGISKQGPSQETGSCTCGKTQSQRIVGGTPAVPGEWCWQAKVIISPQSSGSLLCGGSVINDQYILSAAHCFPQGSRVDVYLGSYRLQRDPDETQYTVQSVIKHPNYNASTAANDIALLRLGSRIRYTNRICSVCLPTVDVNDGANCTITGWGATRSGGRPSDVLMQGNVNIVPDGTCRRQYGRLDRSQICAAAPGVDSCQGDSGGPMVNQKGNGTWDVVGIVSTGRGCADPNFAGIYADVFELRQWIYDNTRTGVYCSRGG